MNFLDSFKMAIHNLWHNKSRSILTIIIVFVVSLLIMAMILLGNNFVTNQESANMQVYEKRGTEYRLMDKDYTRNEGSNQDYKKRQADSAEALKIMDASVKYTDIIDTCYYIYGCYSGVEELNGGGNSGGGWGGNNGKSGDLACTAFDFPLTDSIGKVVEGRIWSKSDVGSNNVWVSSDFIKSATSSGKELGVGDKVSIKYTQDGYATNSGEKVSYNIAGIIEAIESESSNNYGRMPELFVCARYTNQKFSEVSANIRLRITYTPTVGSYDFSDSEKSMKAYVAEVNSALGKGLDYEGKAVDRFTCDILEDMKMTMVMGLIIMGVVILLAFLILLLSVGSIANTIIISVDKNRKFIGLMKAMGLNNKGVKGIVYKEAFVSITAGVGLATLVIVMAQGLIKKLLEKMFSSIFGGFEIQTIITFSFNLLIPLGTLLAFIGMAVLFSKGALNKMGKADPIAIISEVA